jgi:hypothetical protein
MFSAPPPPPEQLRKFYEDTLVPTLQQIPEALRTYPLPET